MGKAGLWIAGLAGLTIGLVAGAFVGSRASSGGGSVSWEAIEAIGTWVGGLGGIAAVIYAVVTFRTQQEVVRRQEDETETEREKREAREQRDANQVQIMVLPQVLQPDGSSDSHHLAKKIEVRVVNGANTAAVHQLAGETPWGPIRSQHTVAAGDHCWSEFHFGGPNQFPAPAIPRNLDSWTPERVSQISIEFEMHDSRWRKQGAGEAERI